MSLLNRVVCVVTCVMWVLGLRDTVGAWVAWVKYIFAWVKFFCVSPDFFALVKIVYVGPKFFRGSNFSLSSSTFIY